MTPQFKHLDITAFEKYFGGIDYQKSVALYLKIANIFLKNLGKNLEELRASLLSDPKLGKVIAHRIKGSLLSLGGNQMAAVFYEVEAGAETKNGQDLLNLLSSKQGDLDQFIEELQTWMKTLEASSSP